MPDEQRLADAVPAPMPNVAEMRETARQMTQQHVREPTAQVAQRLREQQVAQRLREQQATASERYRIQWWPGEGDPPQGTQFERSSEVYEYIGRAPCNCCYTGRYLNRPDYGLLRFPLEERGAYTLRTLPKKRKPSKYYCQSCGSPRCKSHRMELAKKDVLI